MNEDIYPDSYFEGIFPKWFTESQKEIVKKHWRENGLLVVNKGKRKVNENKTRMEKG